MSENILLCDMGGTHARFAQLVERGIYADFKKYRLNDFPSFPDIIQKYMDESGLTFTHARFAVARTPENGVIRYKRFAGDPDYEINFPEIEKQFGWNNALYLNDLEAGAHGANALDNTQKSAVLNAGKTPWNDDKILISVGTGVGHAGIFGNQILKTSGGHFLPVTVTEEQRQLESFIRKRKDKNLSLIMEDFVSARGLRMIAEYTSKQSNDDLSNTEFFTHLKTNPDAVRLFFEFLGMHAHTLMNVTGFYGGLYFTGGVIDHLIQNDLVNWPSFEEYFRPQMLSTMNERMGSCPVYYILDDELPLLGLTVIDDA